MDKLTLEHFKELQGAWARERAECARLTTLASDQQNQISALQIDINVLESTIQVETLRSGALLDLFKLCFLL